MWPLKSSYQRLITLSGPQSGIRSVSFSPDGLFVSAVGYGGVTIWDLRSRSTVLTPNAPYERNNPRHAYSTSAWIYFEGTHKHVFVFGNMAGEMFLWLWDSVHKTFLEKGRQTVDRGQGNQNQEVMSIDVSAAKVAPGHQVNIVTSTSNGVVAVWSLTANLELKNAFLADMPDDILPRTVKFSNGGQVFVFSRDGGSFLQLDGETGNLMWANKEGPKAMLSVSVDEKQDLFAAWIGPNAAMFKLSNSEFVREFKGDEMLFPNAKEVAFAEEGSLLVVGSDHGPVQIFSVLSGQRASTPHVPSYRRVAIRFGRSQLSVHDHWLMRANPSDRRFLSRSVTSLPLLHQARNRPADVLIYKKNCTALRSLSQTKDDANLAFRIGVTWNALHWIGFGYSSVWLALYFALFSYWTAFTLGVESLSISPRPWLRGFIYISALSRFSDLQYNMPRTSTITTTSTEYHTDFLIEYLTDFLTSTTPTS
ncbi:hypothetical protein D9758_017129 [Tetrapyrgos nigripes]|uniref:WD40 repeat-like protein n=1 Tax=Tetrapyrgos nigripes TaxID=182062 RepID=A0A8H5CJR1_9AGAR|nr:hypothetical protein D9758_017129 [Tetrapyrgos nigripes]